MPRDRLRSNVQVRTAGVDGSVAFLIFGLAISAIVLLTLLGTTADSRRVRRNNETSRATAGSGL